MPNYAAPGSPEKKQETRNAQKVARLLAKKLKLLGFQHTKTNFYTRPRTHVLEFVHLHKYRVAPSFRVHFGVRIRSDDFPGAHLNGPCSDDIANPDIPNRRLYDFSFGSDETSIEACAEEIYQCVIVKGLAWFSTIEKPELLLSPGSPLTSKAKAALQRELDSPSSTQTSEATRKIFNAD